MPCHSGVSLGDQQESEIAEAHLEVGTRSGGEVQAEEVSEAVVATRAGCWALRALQVGLGS